MLFRLYLSHTTFNTHSIKFAINLIRAVKAKKNIIYRPNSRGEGSKVLSAAEALSSL